MSKRMTRTEKRQRFGPLLDVKRFAETTLNHSPWKHVPARGIHEINFDDISDDFISGIKATIIAVINNIDWIIEREEEEAQS